MVELLIRFRANVNIPDNNGHIPADLALLTGRPQIMKLLLNSGTEMWRMQPLGGLYAIMAKSEECLECLKLCLAAGAYSTIDLAEFLEFAFNVMGKNRIVRVRQHILC